MPIITWEARHSVQVKEFDSHHQKLVSMINELHDAMRVGKSKEVMADILNKLSDYTSFHFAEEEKYMTKFNYPDYPQHKIQHQQFVQKVSEFKRDFAEGKVLLTMEVMSFLKDWLVGHILGADKNYGAFFNEKGLS